nr:uncharacterized protein LOC109175453 [Ipomoea trifida]
MNTSIEIESSKRLRSVVPSHMRREIDIRVSCDEVLKVKPKTIIYTRVQGGNEENFDLSYGAAPTQDEVAFSAHATIRDEISVAGGTYKLIDENGGMELKQQRNGQVAKNFSDLNNGTASVSNVDIENRVRQWQAQQSWRQTAKINFGDFHASTSSESDEAMKNPAPSGVGGYVADSSLLSNGVTQS